MVWASGWALKCASLVTGWLLPKLTPIRDSIVKLEPGLPLWLPLLPSLIGSIILWLELLQDFYFPPAFLVSVGLLALLPVLVFSE